VQGHPESSSLFTCVDAEPLQGGNQIALRKKVNDTLKEPGDLMMMRFYVNQRGSSQGYNEKRRNQPRPHKHVGKVSSFRPSMA